jgi:hypothetical protein
MSGTDITNLKLENQSFLETLLIEDCLKLTAIKITESWPYLNDTCKLSEDDGKHTGKEDVVQRFMDVLPQFKK